VGVAARRGVVEIVGTRIRAKGRKKERATKERMSRRSHRPGKTTPDTQLDYRSIVGKDWLSVGDAVESRLQQTVQQEASPEIEQYLVSPLSPDSAPPPPLSLSLSS